MLTHLVCHMTFDHVTLWPYTREMAVALLERWPHERGGLTREVAL